MGATGLLVWGHGVVLCFLQMVTASSVQFTVKGPEGPVLVPFGGVLELSCQLSPPQNAEHMEVRWFRSHYTRPVHLYRGGKDQYGETTSKYVERTELLKDAIGVGRVTLRIFNVSIDDDGRYHCVFKDGDDYEEDILEVKVTATSLAMQIHVHPPTSKGVLVECRSGGWFPQPQMEWRDGRGEVIPPTTKSYSQDGDKFFNIKMTLLLNDSSHNNITCCLQNPLTGQEERTSVVLSDKLFSWQIVWRMILGMIMIVLACNILVSGVKLNLRGQSSWCTCISPFVLPIAIIFSSVLTCACAILFWSNNERVSVSDLHFELDTLWFEDISVFLSVMIIFVYKLLSFIYFRVRELLQNFKK